MADRGRTRANTWLARALVISVALLLALAAGCANRVPGKVTQGAAPGVMSGRIFFSDTEKSPLGYSEYYYYLYFWDDSRFSFWKSQENPETVFRRLPEYLGHNPGRHLPMGVHIYAQYERRGDHLEGRRVVKHDARRPVYVQQFVGDFSASGLQLRETAWYEGVDGDRADAIVTDRALVEFSPVVQAQHQRTN